MKPLLILQINILYYMAVYYCSKKWEWDIILQPNFCISTQAHTYLASKVISKDYITYVQRKRQIFPDTDIKKHSISYYGPTFLKSVTLHILQI